MLISTTHLYQTHGVHRSFYKRLASSLLLSVFLLFFFFFFCLPFFATKGGLGRIGFFFLQRYQSLHSHFEGKGEEGNPEYVKKGILEQEWLHNSVDGVFLKTVGLGADLEYIFFWLR